MPERIRVQVADGTWETLGVDRTPGVFPEGITPTWNAAGPDGLAFNLKRAPELVQVDLEEFTPIEYLPDGDRVTWSGFVIDSPGSSGDDPSLAVNALGWQYHLEDDVFKALYVHERLGDWQDLRQRVEADLSRIGTAGAATAVGDGGILLGWAKGAVIGATAPYSGVIFDCGDDPAYWPAAVSIDYVKNTGLAADRNLRVRNNASPDAAADGTSFEDALTASGLDANAVTTFDATFIVKRRYICLVAFYTGAGGTFAEDNLWQITGVRMFGKTAYRSAGQSILKASDVLKDALVRAPLLSQDVSQIATTSLALRHFTADDDTPRAAGDRVNGYHVYRLKVDQLRRLVFQPQLDRAALAVDLAKAGASFRDASTNSGRNLYNSVLVRGRSGSGEDLRVRRYSGGVFPLRAVALTTPAPTNPGFEVNAANWTNVTRSTVNPRTGTAAGAFTVPVSFTAEAVGDVAGADFKAGVTYRFDIYVKAAGATTGGWGGNRTAYTMRAGVFGTDEATVTVLATLLNAGYELVSVTWTPRTTVPASTVKVGFRGNRFAGKTFTELKIDDAAIWQTIATTPDRRGFVRTYTLDVQAPTDTAAMAALGDAFLRLHAYTQLSGELEVTSDAAVRMFGSAAPVPLGDLGLFTGELILLENLIDPDTGDLGRVGIVKTVTKSGDRATIALDNERANFQGLLARMGALSA